MKNFGAGWPEMIKKEIGQCKDQLVIYYYNYLFFIDRI